MPVRGSAGSPVSTEITTSVNTDSYTEGDSFSVGNGSSQTVNPAEVVETIHLTTSASDADIEITTIGGSNFTIDISGMIGTIESYEVDEFVVSVNGDSGDVVNGAWAGE